MKTCPHCQQSIPSEATDCKFCRRRVVRACPVCGEQINIGATVCRHCSSDVVAHDVATAPPSEPVLRRIGAPVEKRDLLTWILVSIFTCGIGAIVWIYGIGADINRHGGRERVNPAIDILLSLLTCGIWNLYLFWKYATEIQAITREEGGTVTSPDLPALNLLIGFFVPVAALAILQNELNGHADQPHT